MNAVYMTVVDRQGASRSLEVPLGISLNLMELLKAEGFPVEGLCGGMAMCATCHIEVLEGLEKLGAQTEAELNMLDTLPKVYPASRLACQIPLSPALEGVVVRLAETE
ncbi:MAG: 2Fe-2S iron-sulfur cluster-binding protein [Flavobacteriales bacterium]|nr:2Fe-2S iron-sulfur cluster-binding protein [Flavobacteriales bacterium]MCX7649532.1 2Fe-2S iron-sulfur cluster-binding protein [Flavobacteriales bacterium]MDW8431245.1 2Fe-2S iron-sulfur cluster-binding protein [Flavobacteriales bacterium]